VQLHKPIAAVFPLVASADDVALSQRLDPAMTGWLNADGFTPARAACARVIVEAVRARNLPVRAAAVAITTAIVESRLHNLDHGDRDSLGLYQQRPSQGWGTPGTDPQPGLCHGLVPQRHVEAVSERQLADGRHRGCVSGRPAFRLRTHRYQPEAADADRVARAIWAEPEEPSTVDMGAAPGGPTQQLCRRQRLRAPVRAARTLVTAGLVTRPSSQPIVIEGMMPRQGWAVRHRSLDHASGSADGQDAGARAGSSAICLSWPTVSGGASELGPLPTPFSCITETHTPSPRSTRRT
jgi:hypothetical protein